MFLASYTPLKLMRAVVARVNNALRLRSDNSLIANLSPPRICPRAVSSAVRNKRRYMEDRHIIIEDIDSLFGIQVKIKIYFFLFILFFCFFILL